MDPAPGPCRTTAVSPSVIPSPWYPKSGSAPIYELLGGRARDRIRVYQWIGGDRPADVGAEAGSSVAEW